MGRDKKPAAPAAPAPTPTNPRDVMTGAITTQQNRYNQQQGPMVNQMAQNYGQASEQNFGDYTDIMNQYRSIASGEGTDYSGGGGGGGGGGGYDAFLVDPERVSAERVSARALSPLERVSAQKMGPMERVKASNPFASYGGFQEFSNTGGYSDADMANMRARGVAPIRAAYANAERNIGQQRSLQGGYSPNAIATQAKMAREQGQGMADASTNLEAQLAQMKQQGRLAGLSGMSNIEQQQLAAQMQGDIFNSGQAFQGNQFDIGNQLNADQFNSGQAFQGQQFDIGNELQAGLANASNALNAGQFNAGLNFQGQTYNANAMSQAQAQNNAAAAAGRAASAAGAAQSTNDRLRALGGMTGLYSATPGLSNMFGNQLLTGVGQGGSMNQGFLNELGNAQQLPDQWGQTLGRINQVGGLVNQGAQAIAPWLKQGQQQGPAPPPIGSGRGGYNTNIPNVGGGGGYQMPPWGGGGGNAGIPGLGGSTWNPNNYDPNEPDWG